jgi:nucleoside-diphosphate-sugar epimerase
VGLPAHAGARRGAVVKCLVTGGLGFLGAALTRALVQAGHEVRVFDNGSRGAERRLGDALAAVDVRIGDIRDPASVLAAVRGCEAAFHLAYVNGTRFFYEKPELVLEVGIKGMLNVLDACAQAGVGDLFVASSSEVYHNPPHVPTPEDVPLVVPDPRNPRFSYSGGKILSELMALHQGGKQLKRVVIFRPHNVYGPDMGWEHVIPELTLRMRALPEGGEAPTPFPIQGSGAETRAYVYVDDFTRGLMLLVEKAEHLGVYNIGTMIETSVSDLALAIARCLNRRITVVPGEIRAGSPLRRCPDTSRIQALGFAPRVSLEEGLGRTVRWYHDHAAEQEPM